MQKADGLVALKREAGENPARTRHCKGGVHFRMPLGDREGGMYGET